MVAVVDAKIDRWRTFKGGDLLPEQVVLIRQMILNAPVQGFLACIVESKSMDRRPTNPTIIAPTLVTFGEENFGNKLQKAYELSEAAPNARTELIRDAAQLRKH
tara:strand:- start:411 stop:722 length:312 start_codon:yes stop_codon:yes gene_type:complete